MWYRIGTGRLCQNQFSSESVDRHLAPADSCGWRIVISPATDMSQCYIPSLYVVHFKGALNSGEAQLNAGFPRVAVETWAGHWAPKNPCLLLRVAPQISPEYGIYDFFAGAAAVTL